MLSYRQKPQGGKNMKKFVPYRKLSKKEKRKLDSARRQTWGALNPVTRKPTNSKAYNRRKTQDWKRETPPDPVFLFCSANYSDTAFSSFL